MARFRITLRRTFLAPASERTFDRASKNHRIMGDKAADCRLRSRLQTLATLTENPQGLPGVNESEDFAEKRKQFWSSVKPAHFGVKIGSKYILGMLRFIFTGLFIGLLGKYSFGRKLLLKFPEIFSLGWFRKTGPTEEEVRSATFKMWFIGKGYSNQSVASQPGSKLDTEIITRVSGPEIGYLTTPIILIQCALIVLGQRENLPKGGVYTPGIVFGPPIYSRGCRKMESLSMSFRPRLTRISCFSSDRWLPLKAEARLTGC
uniref:Uncharacterized protein n=1 Tax=Ananas comosus var. bracteatus TaxID=296719 RepID=A0A6V7P0R0_ANACO|nr:unnamed protein product [Ananas comosus var. bracteatus]